MNLQRRYPVGAELQPNGGVHFRVWAPRPKKVEVLLEAGPGAPATVQLKQQTDGYFASLVPQAAEGTRYRFRLDDAGCFPDPASRYQPDGPHGASQVVDPSGFEWNDSGWHGVSLEGQVIYEMHIGTFTKEGTWQAAQRELAELADCGITVLEVMPVADFPGRFGWGYDGVGQFAPVRLYGEPDDFRRFVDQAHCVGLGVILDVVYNHFGPDGNYLKEFSPDYFTDKYESNWGEPINFDGDGAGPVREFFLTNAAYWIEEFHLDGLRLDATQQIFDSSPQSIMAAIGKRLREAARGRKTIVVAENETQLTKLVHPIESGGYGLDALWNDDFHHSAMVAMTGRNEAYFTDYRGKPQEFISMVKYGYLYQGQRYKWQKQRRGTPDLRLPPAKFVTYIQNHDQIANSGRGERVQFMNCVQYQWSKKGMADLIRVLRNCKSCDPELDPHMTQEWLVTNGLGGYASGTVTGDITRRYHGLLIAALPNPLGRMMILNGLSEPLRLPDRRVFYTGAEELAGISQEATLALSEFRLEAGLPVWRYEVDGYVLEKRLFLPYRQNTVHVTYLLLSGKGTLRLGLRPAMHFRSHDAPVSQPHSTYYRLSVYEDQFEITGAADLPLLRLIVHGPSTAFTFDRKETSLIPYRTERHRGYEWQGSLWSPGYFRADLREGDRTTLVASTEGWDTIRALSPEAAFRAELDRRKLLLEAAPPQAQTGPAAELVLAADQFLITPVSRLEETRVRAASDEIWTVIAGYPWFTDWGRDTMISLEGLTLMTGRRNEAGRILRTFAHYVRDGLIPNMFPEGERDGLYHTADATLWFFHAMHRYVQISNDREILKLLLPKLLVIIEHHLNGTRFGIAMDPKDALLRQGQQGYQLTWMDAKVEDWVVTPRRGKAVEINALWYNALRLMEAWLKEADQEAAMQRMRATADRVRESFNQRFWYEQGGYLYDVVDLESGGSDDACRPNQIFAISLDHPVLDAARWQSVMDVVTNRLLTPVGLRCFAPEHADYKTRYFGDLRSRDAAYHQGTVWAWLIGPYVDVWFKLNPGKAVEARRFLAGLVAHLDEACIGSVSEVFDAEAPYTPRGCVAQAWSVAEVLRCWVNTA